MRRFALAIGVCMCVSLAFHQGCTSGDEGVGGFLSKAFKKGGRAVPVTVQKPRFVERAVPITVPAILTPSDRVEITLPHDARIETFFVNVGETVSRGASLFQVSKEEQNLKLAQLRAEQKEAQANLEKNTYFLRNRDRLLEEGRITTTQYDTLETEVDKNEDDLERIRTQLASLEAQMSGSTITSSPLSGVVQSKLSSAGGVAVANTPIVTVVLNDPMIVNFRLASYEAKTVKKGMGVEVKLADIPGETFKATIESIGAELDRDTNTFEVKATLPNPQRIFKAGMNAFVEFTGSERQKFYVIPASAVLTERRRYFVYTVVQGTAHRVRVIPRRIQGSVAEIVQGLHANDLVIVKGNEKLTEGTVVDIWGR